MPCRRLANIAGRAIWLVPRRLRRHHSSSTLEGDITASHAADLLDRLRAAASGRVGAQTEQAMADVVSAQVAVPVPIVAQIAVLTHHIEQFMHSLPDGLLMMSFPPWPSQRESRRRPCDVPVRQNPLRTFRWACNDRLRQAITCLAGNSRHTNVRAKSIYQAARGCSCDHTLVIRILARAWVRVIWRAWIDRKSYDPRTDGSVVALACTQKEVDPGCLTKP